MIANRFIHDLSWIYEGWLINISDMGLRGCLGGPSCMESAMSRIMSQPNWHSAKIFCDQYNLPPCIAIIGTLSPKHCQGFAFHCSSVLRDLDQVCFPGLSQGLLQSMLCPCTINDVCFQTIIIHYEPWLTTWLLMNHHWLWLDCWPHHRQSSIHYHQPSSHHH